MTDSRTCPPELPGFFWDSEKRRYFPLAARKPPAISAACPDSRNALRLLSCSSEMSRRGRKIHLRGQHATAGEGATACADSPAECRGVSTQSEESSGDGTRGNALDGVARKMHTRNDCTGEGGEGGHHKARLGCSPSVRQILLQRASQHRREEAAEGSQRVSGSVESRRVERISGTRRKATCTSPDRSRDRKTDSRMVVNGSAGVVEDSQSVRRARHVSRREGASRNALSLAGDGGQATCVTGGLKTKDAEECRDALAGRTDREGTWRHRVELERALKKRRAWTTDEDITGEGEEGARAEPVDLFLRKEGEGVSRLGSSSDTPRTGERASGGSSHSALVFPFVSGSRSSRLCASQSGQPRPAELSGHDGGDTDKPCHVHVL